MENINDSYIGTFNYICPRCGNRFASQEMVMQCIAKPAEKGLAFIMICKECAKEGGGK